MRSLALVLILFGFYAAKADAMPDAAQIKLAPGWKFEVFAENVPSARIMQLTKNGDLLVSTYRDGGVLLLKPDQDGDGKSDGRQTLISNLDLPHGLWLEDDALYIAEQSQVTRFAFDGAQLSNPDVVLSGLPDNGGHVSRSLKRGPDGWLYVSVGSRCNVCTEDDPRRASILRVKQGHEPEIFAQGLRNTVGFDWQPETGALYGVDNGRDRLGDDIPDDELNLIERGKHYGWPYRFGRNVADPEYGNRAAEGLEFTPMAHGFGAHVAPLSIYFLNKNQALVAQHGSWNRSRKVGYRLVMLEWQADGNIQESVFLDGCMRDEEVFCRPVDVIQAPDGTIYVSDDRVNAIYALKKD